MQCLSEKPPQSINAGHTSSSAASRLVHKENPNAKKTQAATMEITIIPASPATHASSVFGLTSVVS